MDALSVSNLQLQPFVRLASLQKNPQQQHRRCHFPGRAHHRRGSRPPALSSNFPRASGPLQSLSKSIRAKLSSSDSSFNCSRRDVIPNPPNEHQTPKTLNSSSGSSGPLSFLNFPICVAVAAAALFFSGFAFRPPPSLAEPPATMETATTETTTTTTTVDEDDEEEDEEEPADEQQRAEQEELRKHETKLQEHLSTHPNDVEAVKALLDVKMQERNHAGIIEVASRLIELQPEEHEWRLLKGHMYCFMGELEQAKPVFEEIIQRSPDVVEAYHGLVMVVSRDLETNAASVVELVEVEKRIEAAMAACRNKEKVREFKLLIGQIRVVEGEYDAALKVYQDLEMEEPRDYRPYLSQGIVYTLMRKKDEAKKQFEKYRRFVPKDHPFGKYFEENLKDADKVKM